MWLRSETLPQILMYVKDHRIMRVLYSLVGSSSYEFSSLLAVRLGLVEGGSPECGLEGHIVIPLCPHCVLATITRQSSSARSFCHAFPALETANYGLNALNQ